MGILLELDKVAVGYRHSVVLRSISLQVRSGELLGIFGDNGSGKSTLARGVAGSIPVLSGRIIWNGLNVTRLGSVGRQRLGLVYCPQSAHIFPNLSVLENILLGNPRWTPSSTHWTGEISRKWIPDFEKRLNDKAGEFSGGQQQLLAITRALAGRPQLLLLDEPLSSLSEEAAHSILGELRRLCRSGLTVIVIEHRLAVSAVCDRTLSLDATGLVRR